MDFLVRLVHHSDAHHNLMLFVQVAAELEVLALAEMVEKEERQVKDKKMEQVEARIINLVMEKEAHIDSPLQHL